MMEAKDTVMDYDGEEVGIMLREFLNEAVSDALVDKLLQAQAEVSFRAGIREVVEWIEDKCMNAHAGESLYIPAYKWQAKLKEWGIE